jgi:hypothetical protein
VADASAAPIIFQRQHQRPGDHDRRKMRRVHSGGSGVNMEHRTYTPRPKSADTWLAKYEAEELPIQKRHLNTFLGLRLRDRPPVHNGADVRLREPRRSRGAPRCDVRRPRLARVDQRDPDTRGRSRPGRDDEMTRCAFHRSSP